MSLRWEDERYVRFYTRDTASWVLGPWQARAVLGPILRKLDRAGIVDLGADGLEGLAVLVMMPLDVVEPGVAWWLKRGTFELVEGTLVAPNFLQAQECSASEAQRAREYRARRRDKARSGAHVTKRDGVVTGCAEAPSEAPSHEAPREGVSVTRREGRVTQRDESSRDMTGASLRTVPCRAVPESAPLTLTGEPPTVRPKKAKTPPKHTPEQVAAKERVVEAFVAGVRRAKGIDPKLAHAGEHAAAFDLAKRYGTEAVSIVARALVEPFVLNSNCTLRYIASKADSWRGAAPAAARPPSQAELDAAQSPSRAPIVSLRPANGGHRG